MPTGITKSVTLANGRTATIAKLAWPEMKEARKAVSHEQVEHMRQLGGELMRAFRDMDSPDKANAAVEALEAKAREQQKAALDKPENYDMSLVLRDGVVALDGITSPPVSVLDEATADELRAGIVAFSRENGASPNA